MTAYSHQCAHRGAPCPLARTRYQAEPYVDGLSWRDIGSIVVGSALFALICFAALSVVFVGQGR
jgi:hypothetical protein